VNVFDSKQTGFGRESRFQRWRFLAMTLGAVPQAASERRAFGAKAYTCGDMSPLSKRGHVRALQRSTIADEVR